MFAKLEGDRGSFNRLSRKQFYAWLLQKGYDADRLEPGRILRLADGVTGLLLERNDTHGTNAMRARLVEDLPTGRWTAELTIHAPRQSHLGSWMLLDIDAPALPSEKGTNSRRRWTGTPKIARRLLDVFTGYDGVACLGPEVQRAGKNDVEEVLEVACDPDRRGLVFVAGSDTTQDFKAWACIVQRLLRETVGLAACYLLDPIATVEFNAGMGVTHGVSPGNVRTYLPGADPAVVVDALRHRELTARRIAVESTDTIARMLGRRARDVAITARLPEDVLQLVRLFEQDIDDAALAGVSAIPSPRADPSVPAAEPQEAGIPPERVAHPDAVVAHMHVQPELLRLVQDLSLDPTDKTSFDRVVELAKAGLRWENTQHTQTGLRADLKILRAQVSEQEELTRQLQRQLDDARFDHADVDEERVRAERTVRYLRGLLVNSGRATEAWAEPEPVCGERVSSYDDLLARIESLGRVKFTGHRRYLNELEESDPLATWGVKAWEAAQVLEDYATVGSSGGVDDYLRNVPAGRRAFSRNRHASGESDDVRSNPKFSEARIFPVPVEVAPEGRVAMWAHFKLTQSGMMSPRLHYLDDTARTGYVYIGYIGKHLPTKRTN